MVGDRLVAQQDDNPFGMGAHQNQEVSIHAPVKEATAMGDFKVPGVDVSIHAPVKEATPCP